MKFIRKHLLIGAAVSGISLMAFADHWGRPAIAYFTLIDDTDWSANYSENAFENVKSGMSGGDVQSLLGEPMAKWKRSYAVEAGEPEYDVWSYTRSPGDTHYFMRLIEFDPQGKVRLKVAGFWID